MAFVSFEVDQAVIGVREFVQVIGHIAVAGICDVGALPRHQSFACLPGKKTRKRQFALAYHQEIDLRNFPEKGAPSRGGDRSAANNRNPQYSPRNSRDTLQLILEKADAADADQIRIECQ